MIKYSFVKKIENHKGSDGELREWCVLSHDTGKILSSHTSKDAAEKHLQDMHIHKGQYELIHVNSTMYAVKYSDLLTGGKGDQFDINLIPKDELAAGMKSESEHTSNPEIQKEIVKDHEAETYEITGEPDYYLDYLNKMEEQMKKDSE